MREKKIMVPSRSSKEKYCTSKDHLKCPIYSGRITKKKK